jgi:O-antigen/teichoic acid export membrane protein
VLGLVRLRPFDVRTEEGRSKERYRRVALSALASVLAKLISAATALISVPLTLGYLGLERYGMWMTISSLVAMLAFADLGLGYGLLNAVARAFGKDDRAAIKAAVSSSFVAISGLALVLMLAFAAIYEHVSWHALFNVETQLARQEAGPALGVLVFCFLVGLPLGLVQHVQLGLQRGFVASMWQCVSSLLGLLGVLLAIYGQASLPLLVLAVAGPPLLAAGINGLLFFRRMAPDLAPTLSAASWPAARAIMRSGALFVGLQFTYAITFTSDSFVIARLLGADSVPEYSVPEKLFALVGMGIAMLLTPLWPAYGEAVTRGDHAWVTRTLRRTLLTVLGVGTSLCLPLAVFGPWIVQVWVGTHVSPSFPLLLGLALMRIVESGCASVAAYLNGTQVLVPQLMIGAATALLAVSLKILLVPAMGVAAVAWATLAAYVVTVIVPYAIIVPRLLNRGGR